MRVWVPQAIFEGGAASDLDLLALLRLGLERHRVLLEPLYDPGDSTQPANAWLDRFPESLRGAREELSWALEDGWRREVRDARCRAELRVLLVGEEPYARQNGVDRCVGLPLREALLFLEAPLRVLLENARTDGAFLRAMLPQAHREALLQAEQRRWWECSNGGGCGEVRAWAQTHAPAQRPSHEAQAWAVSRHVAVLDSDARSPGVVSAQIQGVQQACEAAGVLVHVLERRCSENYLPLPALRRWAESVHGQARSERLRRVNALGRLPRETRHHYNMKRGFDGDGIHTGDLSIPHEDWRDLRDGFGNNIRDEFLNVLRDESRQDWRDAREERQRLAQLIQEMM
jgi:hypothetical protein